MSSDITVVINKQSPGVTAQGFGVPLILSYLAAWTERTRTYTSTAGVLADFAVTTPEYLAAAAMFSQSPHVPRIMIGRGALKPTQVQVISVVSVKDSTAYKVHAFAAGVLQTATFTSGVGTTNDLIVDGIVSALNALAAPDIGATSAATGAGGSHVCTTTADAAGNWFALEPMSTSDPSAISELMEVHETNVDPDVATDLAAIALASSAWYGLVTLFNSDAIVAAAAGWAETNTKFYVAGLHSTQIATVADGSASDEAHALKGLARSRTHVMFHPRPYEFAAPAEIGRWFSIDPGGDNWRMKTLSGVSPVNYSETQITNLNAKYCNYYLTLGGINVVRGNGKVSDGEYIDQFPRGIDWYSARVVERLTDLELNVEKIPYTDAGIALIEAEIEGQNKEGIAAGLITSNPAPTVSAPLAVDATLADKQARQIVITTVWHYAGAINLMTVNVTVLA